MTETGYSGTPLAKKLGPSSGQRVMGVGLGCVIVAFTVFTVPAMAQDEKLQLVSEQKFVRLLIGCWEDSWHASFADGSESSGSVTVCFEQDGRILVSDDLSDSTSHRSLKGEGQYLLANDRLVLSEGESADAWPFEREQIDCDAVVRPDQSLQFSNCVETGTSVEAGGFQFARVNE